jgi:hypothetical protein
MLTAPDLVPGSPALTGAELTVIEPVSTHGGAAVAGEMVRRAGRELPALTELGPPEQLLVAAWLTSLRSARTQRAYFADLRAWLVWLAQREVDVLSVGRARNSTRRCWRRRGIAVRWS